MAIEDADESQSVVSGREFGGRLLLRNATGSLGLNLVNLAATVVTTIVLARVMGPADLGVYSFVVAAVTLLAIPAILGADRLLTRDLAVLASRGSYGLARGLVRRIQQLVVGISLLLAIAAGALGWVASGGVVTTELVAFWLGAATLPFLALGRVVQGGLMGLHDVLLGQFPEFIFRPAGLLLLIVVYAAFAARAIDPISAVALYGVSTAAACVVSVLFLRRRTPAAIREARPIFETRVWTLSALSLAFLSGATVANSQIGVTLLGITSTSEAAGLYAVAQRAALLIAFPLAALSAAIGPSAARLWASGEHQRLQRLATLGARGVVVAALPLGLAYLVAGREILTFLFGNEFADAYPALVILTIGQLLNAGTGAVATLLAMTGRQRDAALNVAAGAIINLGMALILIPTFATVGAAVAATASLIVSNVLLAVTARRALGIDSTIFGRRLVRSSS